MKLRIKSIIWNTRKQKAINQNNNKKKESKKNEDSVSSLWDNLKHSNIHIIRMPEGEKKEQEFGKLSEKIVKENFSNLVKEIHIQIQEAQRVPNNLDPKKTTPRYIINKMSKLKDKERILKAAREKQIVTYKGVPIRLSADFSKRNFAGKKGLARNIQSDVKQGPTTKITLLSKAII